MNIHMSFKILITMGLTVTSVLCSDRVLEKRGKDSITSVADTDVEMNKIMAEAQRTWKVFAKHLEKPKKNQRDFMVKYPFETDPGSALTVEHIWLRNIVIKDGKYYGQLANDPFYVKSLKLGKEVKFEPAKISDWKYIENDYLVGGKSIIYLIQGLPAEERKSMLQQIDFKIADFE